MALAPTHAADLHLPVQVHPDLPAHIAMAHLQAVAPQVDVTHPIAAHTPVVHQHHVVIHRAQVHVRHQIAGSVVTVHVIPVRHRVQAQIVANAVTVHVTLVQVLIARVAKTHTVVIAHVAKIHMVAIAHAQAMIAMPVRLRVTANAEAVQIVPEVVSPMIAKSVHAVALAKSA
jgi:hypothetical protein